MITTLVNLLRKELNRPDKYGNTPLNLALINDYKELERRHMQSLQAWVRSIKNK